MKVCQGKVIQQGIAIGTLKVFGSHDDQVLRRSIENTEEEINRFQAACRKAADELRKLYDKALLEVGKSGSAIFEAYLLLLSDEEYLDAVRRNILENKVNAEFAVAETSRTLEAVFSAIDDDYIRARAVDVRDISDRLIRILSGESNAVSLDHSSTDPVILCAEELSPADLLQLDRKKLLAIVTKRGSTNSHAAILARSMEIPSVFGIETEPLENGQLAALDAYLGTLTLQPDKDSIRLLEQKNRGLNRQKRLLHELKGRPSETRDGRRISLLANISSPEGAQTALANDAEGIGLFRTEFLYLESNDYPSEEMQFQFYKSIVEKMPDKKVIIRTLDIGADKQVDYFRLKKEENPALGLRAIRICLKQPQLFRTQLRAIYRASAYGQVAIMFPMITSVEEVLRIKSIAREVRTQLQAEGIPYKDAELGIMIETPAAAVISDLLAKEADFFSIGSNDLAQYALAIDRQNESLDEFYNPHHEAILRMIRTVIENAHREKLRVGICGELAADPTLTKTFLEMGIDELSVSPSKILPLRKIIRETDLSAGHSD